MLIRSHFGSSCAASRRMRLAFVCVVLARREAQPLRQIALRKEPTRSAGQTIAFVDSGGETHVEAAYEEASSFESSDQSRSPTACLKTNDSRRV